MSRLPTCLSLENRCWFTFEFYNSDLISGETVDQRRPYFLGHQSSPTDWGQTSLLIATPVQLSMEVPLSQDRLAGVIQRDTTEDAYPPETCLGGKVVFY